MPHSILSTRYAIFLSAISLLLGACASESEAEPYVPETSDVAVAFVSSSQPIADTRAGVTYSMSDVQLQTTGIGVIAYHTSNTPWASAGSYSPNFMYNQHVTYDNLDTHLWEYEPLKYWPNASSSSEHSYISFFAYAPYIEVAPESGVPTTGSTTEGITAITSNTATGAPKLTYVLAPDAANQVDLLWGTRGKSIYDEADGEPNTSSSPVNTDLTKQTTTERVAFLFKHALACIDVWVQRMYDETPPTDKVPGENAPKIFVNKLQLHFDDNTMYADGRLNLATGEWEDTHDNSELSISTSGDQQIVADLIGTDADNSNLTFVRSYELDDFAAKAGVTETSKRLTRESFATMLIPKSSGITIHPSISYSVVTQDDELALNTVTSTSGTRFSRIMHPNISGAAIHLDHVEGGKRYVILCYIGVEHVSFEVASIEDWDFPLRFTTTVVNTPGDDGKPNELPEEITLDQVDS